MSPALCVTKLSLGYGERQILVDLSLQVERGERVALLGLNGSGKSSLLCAIAGLVAHGGRIEVDGLVVEPKRHAEIRRRLGMVFDVPEDQILFPSVLEDVAFALRVRGEGSDAAAAAARRTLDQLGIAGLAECATHELSHGQKQRVALAGALVAEPALLLLDEPSAGLDPPAKRALEGLLRELSAAMLLTTHDLGFAERVCSRFVLLESGRIALEGRDFGQVRRRWALEG